MKTFIHSNDAAYKAAMSRLIRSHGFAEVASSSDASVIIVDGWIEPADSHSTYLYVGPRSAAYVLPKFGNTLYPTSLKGKANAFYLGIAESPDLLKRFGGEHSVGEVPSQEIVVIVDNDPENLRGIVIPGARLFTRAEEAIDFILLKKDRVKAVLTDLVMPLDSVLGRNAKCDDLEVQASQPSGVLVCLVARTLNLPVAVVTRGHSASPIEEYFRYFLGEAIEIPVIEVLEFPKRQENWLQALKEIEENAGCRV